MIALLPSALSGALLVLSSLPGSAAELKISSRDEIVESSSKLAKSLFTFYEGDKSVRLPAFFLGLPSIRPGTIIGIKAPPSGRPTSTTSTSLEMIRSRPVSSRAWHSRLVRTTTTCPRTGLQPPVMTTNASGARPRCGPRNTNCQTSMANRHGSIWRRMCGKPKQVRIETMELVAEDCAGRFRLLTTDITTRTVSI